MNTNNFAGNILDIFLTVECLKRNHNCSICPLYYSKDDMCLGDIMNVNISNRLKQKQVEENYNENNIS